MLEAKAAAMALRTRVRIFPGGDMRRRRSITGHALAMALEAAESSSESNPI